MEETFEGTFYFDNEKQDWCVHFVKPNKKEAVIKCHSKQISPNLPKNKDEKIQVKFEADKRYYNEVLNVRLKDEENMPDDYKKELAAQQKQENEASANRSARPKGDFHNPYNFVPAIPRNTSHPEFGDDAPSGHDRYIPDKFSGKLTVKMTVKTPLVVLDTARMSINVNDKTHKEFPVRVDSDGKPYINPTAIKGMLRSAYEAITNSRMSSFTKHEDRLAFRMESTEGAMSVPARIENGQIVLYTGTTKIGTQNGKPLNENSELKDDKRERNATLCAAWLPRTLRLKENNAERFPKHNEKFFAWLEKIQHYNRKTGNPDFRYWRVRKLANSKSDLGGQPNKSNDTNLNKSLSDFIEVQGYVCITGENIKNKHDERLFFIHDKEESEIIKIDFDSETHGKALEDLIKNYRKEHSEKNGNLAEPPSYEDNRGNKKSLEWSRPIQRTEFNETTKEGKLNLESIKNSPLCYVRVRNVSNNWIVDELYPVTISRRLHKVSPDDLLGDCLKPATNINKLSPADRVFGWVGKGVSKTGNYRGQVRFGSVVLSEESAKKPIDDIIQKFGQENNPDSWLPLNILGQPKPQQGRFYVAKNKGGDAQVDGLNNENAGYNLPLVKGLRGRKVYPHHAKLPDDYWTIQNNLREYNDPNKEYVRPLSDKQRDSQNRSIEGWITPKTEFEFDIHFTNLSKVELGALAWLLDLPENHFHRFGGGKPYGFGSVKLETIGSEVRDGKDLKTFYMSLDDEKVGKFGESEMKKLSEDFKNLAESAFPTVIESFRRACEGFADKPTHYPRTSKNLTTETKSFEWFVENNRIERGAVKNGYVLQDLANDDGLPYLL